MKAMKSREISLGQASKHSPWLVHEPKNSSMTSTMDSVRLHRSAWPWGSRPRWPTLAEVKSWAAELGQAATQAPQPMQAAASKAWSAAALGTGVRLASDAAPVFTEMNPPASMIRSSGERSTARSRTTGKPAARNGSITISSPSRNSLMWSWQVAVAFCGPWARPLIITPQVPQMPSRQSLSKATGSWPESLSCSFNRSSISRNEASVLMAWW